jgi:3-hydroxyacyl-CoA dehydrogenase/enoyl-CoA hydratase/3-hydroxybutyryl-CoA epimerase
MGSFRTEVRADRVAVITFDAPGAPVNTLSPAVIDEFEAEVAPVLADAGVRAAVLASAKADTFIGGADLKALERMASAAEVEALSRRGNALLSRIAASPKPVVAAIHGAALGGGLEVALACHYLLASDDPATVLALPEVTLGLLPAGGGTQRLPRRLGLTAALPLLLTGKSVRARRARRLGLVDALTTPGGIAETAARAALLLAEGRLARRPLPLAARATLALPARALILRAARRQVTARTRGLYPAPPAVLECVAVGLAHGVERGLEREALWFGRLATGAPGRNLVGLFHAMQSLKKAPAPGEPRPVRRLAVLGAGLMGAGVASVSLSACPVVMRDIANAALASGIAAIAAGLEKQVRSGALTRTDRDVRFSRLHPTTDLAAVAGCDLVVEAVFEELALKRRVLAEVEGVVSPAAVIASNTSALSIAAIAAGAAHPERVLGMHYFSPVPKMPLLELVVAARTAPWAVATARAFAVAQGKTVIVVRDAPGFYTTRILAAYLNEAMLLLEEGASIEAVDRALKDFGFPVGPVALIDEVGIDVAAHVAEDLGARFAERGMAASPLLPRLHAAGFKGRKNRRGFYVYPPPGRKAGKRPNRDAYTALGLGARRAVPPAEIAERMALVMVNEAARCLAEGVIASPRDGDIGAVLGLGFPPFRGGPFHHVDATGAAAVTGRLAALADRLGARFAPAPPLLESATAGTPFFPAAGGAASDPRGAQAR